MSRFDVTLYCMGTQENIHYNFVEAEDFQDAAVKVLQYEAWKEDTGSIFAVRVKKQPELVNLSREEQEERFKKMLEPFGVTDLNQVTDEIFQAIMKQVSKDIQMAFTGATLQSLLVSSSLLPKVNSFHVEATVLVTNKATIRATSPEEAAKAFMAHINSFRTIPERVSVIDQLGNKVEVPVDVAEVQKLQANMPVFEGLGIREESALQLLDQQTMFQNCPSIHDYPPEKGQIRGFFASTPNGNQSPGKE